MSEKQGCTIREFIQELEDFAKQYGDDTEVTVFHDTGDEDAPVISGGAWADAPARIRIM